LLEQLAQALTPSWHGCRAAGRVDRHVDLIRTVAHVVAPTSEDPDAPSNSTEAKKRLESLLAQLQADAPRSGLGAATGRFVDHLVELADRYLDHLFVFLDHPLIPRSTNDLERFFGASKAQLRRALGRGSTAGGVAHNLGGDYLVAFALAWTSSRIHLIDAVRRASREDLTRVRAQVEAAEAPARLRASRRRFPSRHMEAIYAAWEKGSI
jgi:hypothetical protein